MGLRLHISIVPGPFLQRSPVPPTKTVVWPMKHQTHNRYQVNIVEIYACNNNNPSQTFSLAYSSTCVNIFSQFSDSRSTVSQVLFSRLQSSVIFCDNFSSRSPTLDSKLALVCSNDSYWCAPPEIIRWKDILSSLVSRGGQMHSQNVVLTSTCYNFTEHDEFCEKIPLSMMWEKCASSYNT